MALLNELPIIKEDSSEMHFEQGADLCVGAGGGDVPALISLHKIEGMPCISNTLLQLPAVDVEKSKK